MEFLFQIRPRATVKPDHPRGRGWGSAVRRGLLWGALALGLAEGSAHAQVPTPAPLQASPAQRVAHATQAAMLGAAWADKRLVAVGDQGIVLLSDDGGQHFRQAPGVPVSSTLTDVWFVNGQQGWAVGHWGVILATEDGGEHWTVQRLDTQEDRPLFSVHFFDPQEGVAVGLWSLVLRTSDGGKNWLPVTLPAPPDGKKADRNLFKAFAVKDQLYVAAERGMVLHSADRGRSWQYLDTGYKGSFWTGTALPGGALLVGGLRGTLYRSDDGGKTWQALASGTHSSITGLAAQGERVWASALDGVRLESRDGGRHFAVSQREDRVSLDTLAIRPQGEPQWFSERGPLTP